MAAARTIALLLISLAAFQEAGAPWQKAAPSPTTREGTILFAFQAPNGLWGFRDVHDNIAIPAHFTDVQDAFSFREGLAFAERNHKLGFINSKGEWVVPPIYDGTSLGFSGGYAPVMKGWKWGYIDTTGKVVVPFEYDAAYGVTDGYAVAGKAPSWRLFLARQFDMPLQLDYQKIPVSPEAQRAARANEKTFGMWDTALAGWQWLQGR